MEAWQHVVDLLVLLAAALALGTLAQKLRQSAVLGYLAAGTLVGPGVLGWVERDAGVEAMAELGVAVLLFSIGLEFSIGRLRRLGGRVLVAGAAQVVVTLVAASALALFWVPWRAAIAIGAVLAMSSTACVLRLLVDRGEIDSLHGRSAMGILLVQDVAVIPMMMLVLTLSGAQTLDGTLVFLGRTVGLGAALVAGLVVLLHVVMPRLLRIEQWARNRELAVILAFIVALGSAVGAHKAGLPPAIGAFLAGVILGGSAFAPQIRADVGSLRAVLVTLFFVSLGMLGSPAWVAANAGPVLAAVVAIIVGKGAVVVAIMLAMGFRSGVALATALALAHVGEFAFVLAEIAARASPTPLLDEHSFRLIVSATIVSLFVSPVLLTVAPALGTAFDRAVHGRMERVRSTPDAERSHLGEDAPGHGPDPRPAVLIVGFGPAGQELAMALRELPAHRVLVVDLRLGNIERARDLGLEGMVGDATHADVLEHAGVACCLVVAVTVPDPKACAAVLLHCRRLAPMAEVIVRARYHNRAQDLLELGASSIVDEEVMVGVRMAEMAKQKLREFEPATDNPQAQAPPAARDPGPAAPASDPSEGP